MAINAVQTLVAGIIVLRFLVLFIGDLGAISSLFLYGAIIMFLFIAISGAWGLVTGPRKRTSGDQVPAATAMATDE